MINVPTLSISPAHCVDVFHVILRVNNNQVIPFKNYEFCKKKLYVKMLKEFLKQGSGSNPDMSKIRVT